MGSSVFCLVPKGVGTWSHRLYEALLAGCVPVLLSDEVVLPFPDLPWERFTVKWPMRMVDTEIFPNHLRSMLWGGFAATMKADVDKYSCWIDYHSEATDCSPLIGITRQLRQGGVDLGHLGFWRISPLLRSE